MKFMKKLASVVVAAAMTIGVAIPATAVPAMAADETGSITVANPIEGQIYTAYKIFDVVYSTDKSSYSYTIKSDSPWYSVVSTYAGLTLTAVPGTTDTYYVTEKSEFSAPDFASQLKAMEGKPEGTPLDSQSDGTCKADNLELGYYFVTSDTGSLCNLTTTNPDVTIHDKNDVPFEKTSDDTDGSVEVGQKVTYTITGKVPDTTGFSDYTYKITDTMSEGLTFNKDVNVKIGGTDVTTQCTIRNTPSDDASTGFELSIPVADFQNQVGQTITVTYSATVNEKAVAGVSKNDAKLEYTNNPDGSTTSTPSEVKLHSAKIVIDKYDSSTKTKLAGAKFVLMKNDKYYKQDPDNKAVSWVDSQDGATVVTTDENGAATFEGLEDGTYQLKEIEAPQGYNLLASPVEVTIKGANDDTETLTVTQPVENSTGAILPGTGGMGTTMFYVIGGVLVVGAAVALVARKRMRAA